MWTTHSFVGVSRVAWSGGLSLLFAASSFAAVLEVKVADPNGAPLPGVVVSIVETSKETVSGADGTARFEGVAPGRYHVVARASGFIPSRQEVTVAEGGLPVSVALATEVHFSESLTVAPEARDTFESYQPTSVLGGADLQERLGATLGETLGHEAGVNVRSFGPGPARPVIRGLDGDRVLVLENGARTGDLSSQSADHGVTLDPADAMQIEVVRGPATLLYGSSALGGVVNLVSDDIPTKPVRGTHGNFVLQGGTANEEAGLSGNVMGGSERWAFRAAAAGHRTEDAKTPDGTIPNSQSELKTFGGSIARTGDNGYAGISYHFTDTRYGIPFVEEGGTTLDPRRHTVDLRLERRNLSGFVQGLKLQGGYRNYRASTSISLANCAARRSRSAPTVSRRRPTGTPSST